MSLITNLVSYFNRKSAERMTINQLSAMTDKELNDIGICRCDIRRVACEAEFH